MVQYTTMSSLQIQIASTNHHITPEYNAGTIDGGASGDMFMTQLEKRASSPVFTTEKLKELYVESLSPKEHKAYLIAKNHLGMSFTLEKSVGFLEWKKTFMANASS